MEEGSEVPTEPVEQQVVKKSKKVRSPAQIEQFKQAKLKSAEVRKQKALLLNEAKKKGQEDFKNYRLKLQTEKMTPVIFEFMKDKFPYLIKDEKEINNESISEKKGKKLKEDVESEDSKCLKEEEDEKLSIPVVKKDIRKGKSSPSEQLEDYDNPPYWMEQKSKQKVPKTYKEQKQYEEYSRAVDESEDPDDEDDYLQQPKRYKSKNEMQKPQQMGRPYLPDMPIYDTQPKKKVMYEFL